MRLIKISIILCLVFILAACNLPGLPAAPAEEEATAMPTSATVFAPSPSTLEPATPMAMPSLPPTEAATPVPPQASATPEASATQPAPAVSEAPALPPKPAGPQLAFLKDKDIWLLDQPGGTPYQLTVAGDIMTFAWAPDGERLAAYNGKQICFVYRDGQVRSNCLELGLQDPAQQVERRIVWSADQRWIVLWNPVNPWDENAVGWMILSLENDTRFVIQDPVDWGASLAPNNEAGGITGEPLFLADGRLVGTLTHRLLCGQGGCHYQLFQFDIEKRAFVPYPNKPDEGWSEGLHILLGSNKKVIFNYGVFFIDCSSYVTFVDQFNLEDQSRKTWNLDNQAVVNLALNPAASTSILARTSACPASTTQNPTWAQTCGLTQGYEVLPMQWWKSKDEFVDLIPGVSPTWTGDGQMLAFRSCLSQGADGKWNPDGNTPSSIYLWNPADGSITIISPGQQPQWRP
jgi:hypothetical protein